MFHPDIQAALATERRNTMLAEAAATRLARQARRHRRVPGSPEALRWWRFVSGRLFGRQPRTAADGRRVVLRDGSHVLIRQVQGADAPPLTEGLWPAERRIPLDVVHDGEKGAVTSGVALPHRC
jgi:hypothetical protein